MYLLDVADPRIPFGYGMDEIVIYIIGALILASIIVVTIILINKKKKK